MRQRGIDEAARTPAHQRENYTANEDRGKRADIGTHKEQRRGSEIGRENRARVDDQMPQREDARVDQHRCDHSFLGKRAKNILAEYQFFQQSSQQWNLDHFADEQ